MVLKKYLSMKGVYRHNVNLNMADLTPMLFTISKLYRKVHFVCTFNVFCYYKRTKVRSYICRLLNYENYQCKVGVYVFSAQGLNEAYYI